MTTATATLTINDILPRLMFERKIRATELARNTKLPQPTVHRIVTGETPKPHRATVEALANYFQISVEQLKGLEPIPWLEPKVLNAPGWTRIPVLSWDQANDLVEKEMDIDVGETLYTDAKVGDKAFALKMLDASMEPQFPKGTLLIIDPDKISKDRSFVIAKLKKYSASVFRQLLIDGPHSYLKPLSPDFEQFKMTLLNKEDKVIGVLVQARKDYSED